MIIFFELDLDLCRPRRARMVKEDTEHFFFENPTLFRPTTNAIKNSQKYKGNFKIYKGKYTSKHFGSHFSHIGLINLIS